MRPLHDLRAEFLPGSAKVLGFEGEESLSALYTFRVTLCLPLHDALDDSAQVSLLRLDLVPALWKLGLGEHSRVFVNQSFRDIVAETLTGGGLTSADFELRLADADRP